MACAYLAWDPKTLAGSVVGGRFRLERLLHASSDAVTYSATDVQASRAVVVELSARPDVEQSASRARTLDEGFTVQGWHYAVLEPTADLREWKIVRCHGESLAATFWQTADGSLLVELPVQIWGAQGTIPRGTSSAAARSPVSSPDLPHPPACGSSTPASRDCFSSEDYEALTPVTPIALTRSSALCEQSPGDQLPLEVPDPEIPVYVELPADPRDTERPVVREVCGRDSDAPTPTRSRRARLMLTGALCVACALFGWRGASHLLPAISAGPPRTAAVAERRATTARAHPIELRTTSALPVPSAPATGAVAATATARSSATPPEQSSLARRPVASKRPRRANSAVASRTDRETPPPNLKNPYIFAPREL